MHLLNHGADGKYRKNFKEFSRIYLVTGKGDKDDFLKAFEGVDLSKLESEWFEYVRKWK